MLTSTKSVPSPAVLLSQPTKLLLVEAITISINPFLSTSVAKIEEIEAVGLLVSRHSLKTIENYTDVFYCWLNVPVIAISVVD